MRRTLLLICLATLIVAADRVVAAEESVGYLKKESNAAKGKGGELVGYVPREGDLVFYDDRNPAWMVLFAYAGTGPPLHMGIVVKKADGSLAVLEAGPDDTTRVALLDIDKRLRQFHADFQGGITIRRCKKELTKEQSAALTKFAQAQDGKRYAVGRLLLQGTALRSRGPVREAVLGKTWLDRKSWFCSELSVAAGSLVQLFDPDAVRANATYPRDLVDNQRHDLSVTWHDAAPWLPVRPKERVDKK